MNCIAILESGNYVYNLSAELEKKGYNFEVVSTPCHVAKGGCGLCLRFPEEFFDMVKAEASINKTPILEVYRIVVEATKSRYERIF